MRLDQKTLRAIGQDLEALGLFDFDLELKDEQCVVRGFLPPASSPEPAARATGWKGLLQQVFGGRSAAPEPPAPKPVERTYGPREIEALDALGRARRGESSQPPAGSRPDVYTTRELLRVFGVYCQTVGQRLLAVSKRGNALQYEYLDRSEQRRTEECLFPDLYDFAYGLIAHRKA